jgi:DnaJ like chaperone protein
MPLRLELRQFVGKRIRVEVPREEVPPPPPEVEPVSEPEALSAIQILGISETATLAEIKTAYRNRMKEWHPDRFPNLDEESRRMAEDWTKALNAAYEELMIQRNGRKNR